MKSTNQTPTASASRHTPEPWQVRGANRHGEPFIVAGCLIATVHHECVKPEEELEANAARIVACVNALAGMEPGAVAALVAAAEQYLQLNTVGNRALLREALAALKGGAK